MDVKFILERYFIRHVNLNVLYFRITLLMFVYFVQVRLFLNTYEGKTDK
jgi:hypothetical protein